MKGSRSSQCVAVLALALSVGVATAEAQPYVYVLGRDANSHRRNLLTVIDGATSTKGPRISLGASNGFILPQAMAMAPDGDRIYVVNDLDSTISVVSTQTNTVYVVGNNQLFIAIDVGWRSRVATVTHNLGGALGVAASPDGTRVYMMATGSDTLAVLSTAPYAIIARLPLDLQVSLLRGDTVALSPDGRFLYLPQFSTVTALGGLLRARESGERRATQSSVQ